MNDQQLEQLREEIEEASEEKNLEALYDILIRYRMKADTIVCNIESGRVVFAHQKLKGLINGLDYIRGRISIRLDGLDDDEEEGVDERNKDS